MSYSTRRYAMDRARDDRAEDKRRRIDEIRSELDGRGLGTTKVRATDRRTLVLDASGWVHAVVWSSYDQHWRTYRVIAVDLLGDAWAPGSRPWEPRATAPETLGEFPSRTPMRSRGVRASVATVLRDIRRRLGPGEGISAVTRAELAIVRHLLVDGLQGAAKSSPRRGDDVDGRVPVACGR
jgi:hypothetical protein